MSLVDDAKAKLEEAKSKAEELKDDVSEKAYLKTTARR